MLKVLTLEQSDQWDLIVQSFKQYDVYWLSGYVKAFKINGDGEPLLFFYEDESVRGINVVMKRDIAKDIYFVGKLEEDRHYDLSTVYGYGGWIIEGENTDELFKSYESYLMVNNIISEFVRFHPLIKNHNISYYDVTRLGEVVSMDLSSPEIIWSNIISKNRNVIRKAIKSGIKIYHGNFPKIYDYFYDIYNTTMERDNANEYYFFSREFYDSILNDLEGNVEVFWAELDGKVIATSVMLMCNGYMNYHLSGSLREYSSFAPTNLLLYKAALWGYKNGYRSLYLGGGVGSEEDNLFKFKRAFYRGDLNHFYIGKKIYNKDVYDDLVSLRGDIESKYFPRYRG